MLLKEFFILLGIKVDGAGFGGAQKALFSLGQGIRDLKDIVGTLFSPIVDAISSIESMKAALVTVEGSTEAANAAFERLKEIAAKTPFSIEQVTAAYQRLKIQGLDASESSITAWGDMASSFQGKEVMQVVEAVSDATIGQYVRLNEFGIKMNKAGSNVEILFKGVKTTVKNNAKDIQAALFQLATTNFGGAMERQSKTLGGQISNLKDQLLFFLGAIGEEGLGEPLKELVTSFADWLKNSKPIASILGKVLGAVVKLVRKGVEKLSMVLGFLVENFGAVAAVMTGVLIVAIIANWNWIVLLTAWYGYLGAAAVLAALKSIAVWLLAAAPYIAIALLIALLILLFEDLYGWLVGDDSLIGSLWEKYKGFIKDWLKPSEDDGWIIRQFKAAIQWIITIGENWDIVVQGMRNVWDGFMQWLSSTIDSILNPFKTEYDAIVKDLQRLGIISKEPEIVGGAGTATTAEGITPTDLFGGLSGLSFGSLLAPSPTGKGGKVIAPKFDVKVTIPPDASFEETKDAVERGLRASMDTIVREAEVAD